MNLLRKIGAWIWLNKERMVLGVMVCILMFRVYQVLNPAPPDNEKLPRPPDPEPAVDVPVPPALPPNLESRDWSKIWRRTFWRWEEARTGSRSVGQDATGPELDIQLEQIKPGPDGAYRAKIRTASRSGWYTEGQDFEQFTLMSIDSEKGCVVIFSEQQAKNVTECIGATP